ncbi:MAG TPA: helix-turn-helix domain-containing protein [Planctomycetota bacterium]|nr:helix-turn-helix domain-containing protein [Planctomycetota bacterium]
MGQFGDLFKQRRLALGLSLRQFCLEHGLDPGNISKLERGRLAPPQHDKLEEYARLLGLQSGTDDWYRFFDLAAAEAGRIPRDIMTDEQVVERLPLLFRTLRGEKIPDEQLDEIVRKVKGA